MNIHLVLCIAFLARVLHAQNDKSVLIKWISPDRTTETVDMTQKLKKNNGEVTCIWYKLVENQPIDEDTDLYVYKRTKDECSLIMTRYESSRQIDFYKPSISYARSSVSNLHDKDPYYALAYLKSFEIIKKKKSKNVFEYNCEVVFALPNTEDEALNSGIKSAIEKNLMLDGFENTPGAPAAIKEGGSSKTSGIVKVIKRIKNIFRREKRQDNKDGFLNLFMINLAPVEVIKGSNSETKFVCQIELIDELSQTPLYSKTLTEDSMLVSNSLRNKLTSLALVATSYVILILSLSYL